MSHQKPLALILVLSLDVVHGMAVSGTLLQIRRNRIDHVNTNWSRNKTHSVDVSYYTNFRSTSFRLHLYILWTFIRCVRRFFFLHTPNILNPDLFLLSASIESRSLRTHMGEIRRYTYKQIFTFFYSFFCVLFVSFHFISLQRNARALNLLRITRLVSGMFA